VDRIYYGDCLEGMAGIADQSIDLILTDPPYEIEDMSPFFRHFKRILKETGSLYVFGNKNIVAEHWFRQLQMPYKEILCWYYKNSPKPRGRWRMSMQVVIYGYFSDDSTWNEDEARVEYQPATKKLNGRIRPSTGRLDEPMPYDTSKGALPRDVIEYPALLGHLSRERVGHPDQKPLGLVERLIRTSSNEGDLVLDAFAGSGTTVFACVNTNRHYIAFEQSEAWCNFIYDELYKCWEEATNDDHH
jgi:site-specific DNA-methyltransferase (adenine-specific)